MSPDVRPARNLRSPAGNKNALAERLIQAIYNGADPIALVQMEDDKTAGVNNTDNNYSRPDGQNTGNFITDKPSSRVIHNPGGGSSICLGDAEDEPKAKQISHLKQKDIAGSGIFAPQDEMEHTPSRLTKNASNAGSGIFDEHVVEEAKTSPMSYSRQKSVAAAAGSDIFAKAEADPLKNVVGGVRKPPGGGSSIVF